MAKKFKGKDWKDLDPKTKYAYKQKLDQLYKKGLTIPETKAMSDADLGKALGVKASTASNYRRIYRQIQGTTERRKETTALVVDEYTQQGFGGKRLEQMTKDIVKTAGSTFDAISADLQTLYNLKNDPSTVPNPKTASQKANKIASNLLKIPKDERDILDSEEERILDYWSP